jgi:hypothetical protein
MIKLRRSVSLAACLNRECNSTGLERDRRPLVIWPPLPLRGAGLQSQRMQLATHFSLEGLVNDLVLLDAGLAAK